VAAITLTDRAAAAEGGSKVGSASISVAVSSVSAELSVECSLSALKAVVEGEMKLEEGEGAPGSMEWVSNKNV
jgi:hypothetical protein